MTNCKLRLELQLFRHSRWPRRHVAAVAGNECSAAIRRAYSSHAGNRSPRSTQLLLSQAYILGSRLLGRRVKRAHAQRPSQMSPLIMQMSLSSQAFLVSCQHTCRTSIQFWFYWARISITRRRCCVDGVCTSSFSVTSSILDTDMGIIMEPPPISAEAWKSTEH